MTAPLISAVLGSYNRRRFLARTVESLRRELSGFAHEIIVVDGGSTDGALRWLTRQRDVLTIIQHNRGTWRGVQLPRRSWGYFMNLGFRCASGRHVLMVSDDCLLVPGGVPAALARFEALEAEGRRIGAMAFYWRDTFRRREYVVGLTFGRHIFVNHGLFQRDALADVGYCDEEHYAFYHADGDLCLRMRERGWEVTDAPDSYVEHFPHATREVRRDNLARAHADWDAYRTRWAHLLENDPFEGGALIKAFDDPHRTALRFPPYDVASLVLRRAASRMRKAFDRGARHHA
ncbi:GT2 family glycosyltransferase [Desulfobaculum xiamenense]|uniref:GT2 family glycosyltransferase n=1 Tax=Desulfobaculum xiamenense TaxID=995050 RepID=A0A846QRN8_9BACT|nr:glycosyltransferase [Desulfobaculum xiamenense]NJB69182.1 GT2 family glycosyltransferase [Desulfobaculum xiamenense]